MYSGCKYLAFVQNKLFCQPAVPVAITQNGKLSYGAVLITVKIEGSGRVMRTGHQIGSNIVAYPGS